MRYDAVALVASAGGPGQLRRVLAQLPPNLPVPVLCMYPPSLDVRNLQGLQVELPIRVEIARAEHRPEPGVAYFPPFGATILMREDGLMTLAPFGPESGPLGPEKTFLSCIAKCYGGKALAAILSSDNADTLEGARALREAGGCVVAADVGPRLYAQASAAVIGGGQWDQVVPREQLALAIKVRVIGSRAIGDADVVGTLDRMLGEFVARESMSMGEIHLLDRDADALSLVTHRGLDEHLLRRLSRIALTETSPYVQAVHARQRVVTSERSGTLQATPLQAHGFHLMGVFSTRYAQTTPLTPWLASALDQFARDAADVAAGPLGP